MPKHLVATERVEGIRSVDDPVDVAPPQRPETGLEAVRRHGDRADHHVLRHDPGQATEQPVEAEGVDGEPRHVDMADLTAGVHPRIGTTGDDRARRAVQAQHALQGLLDDALDRAEPRLDGPAAEVGAVIAQVEAETDEPAVPRGGDGGLGH